MNTEREIEMGREQMKKYQRERKRGNKEIGNLLIRTYGRI